MPEDFCTYFDHRYLARGLILSRSLASWAPGSRLFVLCFDDEAHRALTALAYANIVPIALGELEAGDGALQAAKENRTRVEYYFTCTSSLPLYIFARWPDVAGVTYLDADLCFFGDPQPVFDEIGTAPIAIVAHRFPEASRDLERYGVYNVGWLTFRRGEAASACLTWWRDRCLEWCYDRAEDGRFADQKYLDDWPSRFEGVVVIHHKGANLAPWNLANYTISWSGGRVLVDADPLVFFHFHSLRRLGGPLFDLGLDRYGVRPNSVVLRHIFEPYLQDLAERTREAARVLGASAATLLPRGGPHGGGVKERARWVRDVARGVGRRQDVLYVAGRVV